MTTGNTITRKTNHRSIAFISDIHGNVPALLAVLDATRRAGVEKVVCLGDIIDMGPQPEACVQILIDNGIECVQGNHELLNEAKISPLMEIEQWTAQRISARTRDYLDSLPQTLTIENKGSRVICTHGSPRSQTEGLLRDTPADQLAEMLASVEPYDAVVAGHTHVQMVRRENTRTIMNVGSVGMPFKEPFNGAPPEILSWAEYGVIRWDGTQMAFELCRINYSLNDFALTFDDTFPDRYAWLKQWLS